MRSPSRTQAIVQIGAIKHWLRGASSPGILYDGLSRIAGEGEEITEPHPSTRRGARLRDSAARS